MERRVVGLTELRQIIKSAQSDQITFLAAGVAYYAFVSLLPLMLLGLVIASIMGGEVFQSELLAFAGEFLTPDAQELLLEALAGEAGRSGATAVGFAVLLWSGLRLFRGLDKAFSQVYGTSDRTSIVKEMRNGVMVLGAIIIGVAAVTIVGTAISRLPMGPFGAEIATAILLATLIVAFYPMYFVMPDADISPWEAVPGTMIAAIGWVLLGAGFQFYTAQAGEFAAYGVLGAVLLLVTWLYFGALIVMVGAVVNAVLGGRSHGPLVRAEGVDQVATGPTDPGPIEEEETPDRQVQPTGDRHDTQSEPMTDEQRENDDESEDRGVGMAGPGPEEAGLGPDEPTDEEPTTGTAPASEVARLNRELAALRAQLDEFEDDVENRTVRRNEVEADLKRYVRRRIRRGKARGWGPYLVLLYGTAMTIGAFAYLDGGWAILAMLVVWLSTLGLYVLMVLVTAGLNLLGVPGRLRNAIGDWRS